MAQVPSYNVPNQPGAAYRANVNDVLQAIKTVNSGPTEPPDPSAHMCWIDTANSEFKIRNAANSTWLVMPFAPETSLQLLEGIVAVGDAKIRAELILGLSSSGFALDPGHASAGDELKINPTTGDVPDTTKVIGFNRANGGLRVGRQADALTELLDVDGAIRSRQDGYVYPDGTQAPTAGIVGHAQVWFPATLTMNPVAWERINNLQIQYTPTKAGNVLQISATLVGACTAPAFWSICKDGEPIMVGNTAGSRTSAHGSLEVGNGPVQVLTQTVEIFYVTADANLHDLDLRLLVPGGENCFINRAVIDSDASGSMRGASFLRVFELAV